MKHLHAALVIAGLWVAPFFTAHADSPYQKVQPLLDTSKTVLDEPLRYPDGSPLQVSSTIVTITPGEETGWHKHGVPMYAYILSGEVTVDYGERGTRTFGAGTAMVEAMDQWHRGTNRGQEPVRILVVYMGSDKARNVLLRAGKKEE
ncbi:MAG: cupin domain-containing protein [Magnetococcales bacterium]|nr:cupin domain-containing protein [Magnetococcales bacterium]